MPIGFQAQPRDSWLLFTVARNRGEWGLAWAALALAPAFATLGSPFLFDGLGAGE